LFLYLLVFLSADRLTRKKSETCQRMAREIASPSCSLLPAVMDKGEGGGKLFLRGSSQTGEKKGEGGFFLHHGNLSALTLFALSYREEKRELQGLASEKKSPASSSIIVLSSGEGRNANQLFARALCYRRREEKGKEGGTPTVLCS